MLKFILIAAAIQLVSSQKTLQIVDLCKTDLCDGNHLTCQLKEIQSKAASGCARILDLTEENKQAFLDAHNEKRNLIANGKQPGFNSATRMATVEWDQTLADYALLNIMRCDFAHDCHATKDFPFSGQNIAGDFGEDLNKIAYSNVENWYSEVKKSDQSAIDNCCSNYLVNGHFTQVVRDTCTKIGCAVGIIPYNGEQMTYTVCNYSYGNLDGKSYKSGAPASECKTGTNPKYPALCSSAENIDQTQ